MNNEQFFLSSIFYYLELIGSWLNSFSVNNLKIQCKVCYQTGHEDCWAIGMNEKKCWRKIDTELFLTSIPGDSMVNIKR